MLPIICIALVQEEHVYWYGHVEACGSGLLWHGLNFSTAWCTTRLSSVEKDWKHVLMQKMVILNTCCDIACLTFQLPHTTTGSFQSHRRQPTTGSPQSLQRLKERNKPSVRWKSFAVHKLVWWHFRWGGQVDYSLFFFWDNVNNQKYERKNTVENDFYGFSKVKWLHLTYEVDKCVRFSCENFLRISHAKIFKIG